MRRAAVAHQITRTLYAPRPSLSARILSRSSSFSSAGRSYSPLHHHHHHHPLSLHPALGQRTMATSKQPAITPAETDTRQQQQETTEGREQEEKPVLLLEDSSTAEETHKIDLSDGGQGSVKLDSLGPLVVHKDGTTSRISNWGEMTQIERENTLRVLGKRNQLRLGQLRGEAAGNGNADGSKAS